MSNGTNDSPCAGFRLPQNPVFIVGYPRSGTTLVLRLLLTRPGLYAVPETHYFNVVERAFRADSGGPDAVPPDALPQVLDRVAEKMDLRLPGEIVDRLSRRAERGDLTSKDVFELIVGHCLLRQEPSLADGRPFRWIEKTPNHAHFLERIFRLYPRFQAIHVLRHPVPAIFSRKLKFPFNREIPLAELARRWSRTIDDVERFRAEHPGRVHILRYEDLFVRAEAALGELSGFLAISLDAAAIAALSDRPGPPPEFYVRASEPWKWDDMRREVANTNEHYRTLFTDRDAAEIEAVVGNVMAACGYGSYRRG